MIPDLSAIESEYGLPAGLLHAVMTAESSGDPNAVSPKGARGLFQFMPETAKAYGIDPMVPEQAARGTGMMFRDLSKQYDGDLDKMLAAYNWGSGNIAKSGMERMPKETSDYINKVKQYAQLGGTMNDASPQLSLEQQRAIAIAEAEAMLGEEPEAAVLQPQQNKQVSAPKRTGVMDTIRDQWLQGTPLIGTFMDEVQGDLGALGASAYLNYRNAMPEILGGYAPGQEIEDFSTEQLFEQGRQIADENVRAQQEERPALSVGTQLGSGLFTGGAMLKGATKVPTILKGSKDVAGLTAKMANWTNRGNALRRSGKIIAAGVPTAALYGGGASKEGERLEGALEAAPFGMLPAALPLGGAAIDKLKPIKSALLPPKAPINATNKMLQRLAEDNMTPEGLASRLSRAPEGSAIIDVGRGNLERLAEASSNLPGKGANNAVRFVSKRLSSEPKNIKSAVSNFIASGDFDGAAERIMKEADEAVQPLYKEVYQANPSVASPEIDRILSTPAGNKALKKAAELMQNDRKLVGFTDPELAEQLKLAGEYTPGGVAAGLKMQTLDYAKRALDDMWRESRGTNEGRIINNLRRDLVGALDEADASGKYKEARKIWAGAMGGQEALEKGRDVLKMDTAELKKYFKNLGDAEKELFKLGAAQNLRDVVSSSPDRTNMARKIFGREEYRENLRAILGREEFNKLRASLVRQEKQHLLSGRLLGNSRTALRSAEMEDLNIMDPQAAAQLMTGDLSGFLNRGVLTRLKNRATGLTRDTAGEITSSLFETDPAKQKQILDKLISASKANAAKSNKRVSPLMAVPAAPVTSIINE